MSDELLDAIRNIFILFWFCTLFSNIFANGANYGAEKLEMELRAFRLQQFEAGGKLYGSRSWKISYETASINELVLRKCMIVLSKDLLNLDFDAKFSAPVGAVLVIIPADFERLAEDDKKAFIAIEQKFAAFRTDLAIYFATDSSKLRDLLSNADLSSGKAQTAIRQLINSMVADNYQISTTDTAVSNVANNKMYNVIAHLNAVERGRPYLFIVAHYDTYGIIPALTVGSDSNGSGVAVLLELLAIFSQLYFLPSHRARYNLVFVLSVGGKFSYQGSRGFIDDFNERHSDEQISLAVCLDGLASGRSLYVHTSKAPSEGSALRFVNNLKSFDDRPVELITKKISLASERLAWEHEIYNIRRIHALTVSHFKDHADPFRNSLLDNLSSVNYSVLQKNTKAIVNSLVSFVFALDSQLCQTAKENRLECSILNEAINVDGNRLRAWIELFGSKPRPIVVPQQKLLNNLYEIVKRFAHSAHISEVAVNDFVLYNIIEETLTANVVKPAIFELILATGICVYLYALYFTALNAQSILEYSIGRIRNTLFW